MKNILYIGQFKDAAGYGNAARGYLKVLDKFLDKAQYNLKIFALNFEKEDYSKGIDRELIQKYNLNPQELIQFINNNKYTLFLHTLPTFYQIDTVDMPLNKCVINSNCEKKINFVAWETDTVPQKWKEIYDSKIYDELVVFCSWNKQVFESQTSLKATVVPHAIYDYFELDKKQKNDKFRIFSMSQWQHRKGFDILIRAYCQEFFDQDDVELFIKTYRDETSRGVDEESQRKIIINDISKYKSECSHYGKFPTCKILLKTGFCSNEEIKKMYEEADVFCSPTRGEGFGMTIAQAAMSGVPCVIPDMGGHLEYLDKNNNYFIKSEFDSIYNMSFNVYSSRDMKYIYPSISSTRNKLRQAYSDWKNNLLQNKSKLTKSFSRSFLNEKNIFNYLKNIIN